MIHSLIGQSEVLTLSGVYLLTLGYNSLGPILIGMGAVGSLARWGFNCGVVSRGAILDHDEPTRILKD